MYDTCMMHCKLDVYILPMNKKLITEVYFLINNINNVCT